MLMTDCKTSSYSALTKDLLHWNIDAVMCNHIANRGFFAQYSNVSFLVSIVGITNMMFSELWHLFLNIMSFLNSVNSQTFKIAIFLIVLVVCNANILDSNWHIFQSDYFKVDGIVNDLLYSDINVHTWTLILRQRHMQPHRHLVKLPIESLILQ